jgi:DNA-binding SARP family transcriptional activator
MGEASSPVPRFRVLGPTEAHGVRGPVDLGAPQQRCVLTFLLLEAGRVVSLERLIDAVWPTEPPATARKAIQVYVSHLRRALVAVPAVELVTVRPGYRLDTDPGNVDVHRFRALVEQAKDVSAARVVELLTEALDLWRGPAVADVSNTEMRGLLVAGLEEERRIAFEERIVAELCLGRAQHAVSELTEYVAAHPLRERGYRLLMRALYQCGRQAEALAAYQDARRVLAERLGTEPGPELRILHEQLLRGRMEPDVRLGVAPVADFGLDQPFGGVVAPRTMPGLRLPDGV